MGSRTRMMTLVRCQGDGPALSGRVTTICSESHANGLLESRSGHVEPSGREVPATDGSNFLGGWVVLNFPLTEAGEVRAHGSAIRGHCAGRTNPRRVHVRSRSMVGA